MNLCKQNIGNRKEVKILICIMKEILTGKISRLSRKKRKREQGSIQRNQRIIKFKLLNLQTQQTILKNQDQYCKTAML